MKFKRRSYIRVMAVGILFLLDRNVFSAFHPDVLARSVKWGAQEAENLSRETIEGIARRGIKAGKAAQKFAEEMPMVKFIRAQQRRKREKELLRAREARLQKIVSIAMEAYDRRMKEEKAQILAEEEGALAALLQTPEGQVIQQVLEEQRRKQEAAELDRQRAQAEKESARLKIDERGGSGVVKKEIFGVPEDASFEDVRKAYKKRALQFHSDRLLRRELTPEERNAMEEKSKELNSYFEYLKAIEGI